MAEPLLLQGLKGERASLDELIRRFGMGKVTILQLASSLPIDPDAPPAGIPSWYKLWFDLQRVLMLTLMNQAVAIERSDAPRVRACGGGLSGGSNRAHRLQ